MNSYKPTIEISETANEYLLRIPPSQKERAKSIAMYKWDVDRKCWVYPKTVKSYDALIEEFGDDIVGELKIQRPARSSPPKPEDIQIENQNLKEDLAEIRKTLELISQNSSSGSTEIQTLQQVLAAKEKELVEVRLQIHALEKLVEDKNYAIQELSKDTKQLRHALKHQLSQEVKADIYKWLKDVAKAGSEYNEKFCRVVEKLSFEEDLSTQIGRYLEFELKKTLVSDNQRVDVFDLMKQAEEAGIFDDRSSQLAHLIRKQRNIAAHEIINPQIRKARGLLCLFAASLLWKELPD